MILKTLRFLFVSEMRHSCIISLYYRAFEKETNAVDFTLRCVLCVVDLLRAGSLLDETECAGESAGALEEAAHGGFEEENPLEIPQKFH